MAHNKYIADAEVEPFHCPELGIRGTFVYGRALYDPHALLQPCFIPREQLGKPHQMVLHIAGVAYYPTKTGAYVPIANPN